MTTYSYDPFGNTTTAGAVSANPSQYTGRENEGNGLYFYRARYYSPALHRFVSEDPLGFVGGDRNFYAYVGNDPINASDPSGLVRKYYNLGQGWTAGVDRFNEGGQANFEIHVLNGDTEVGVVKGAAGWVTKHGQPATYPPGITDDIANAINGINVQEMRANGTLPEAFRGGAYLDEGRVIGPNLRGPVGSTAVSILPMVTIITGYIAQESERAARSARGEMHVEEHMCDEARFPDRPDWVDTRLGPMPAHLMGCPDFPGMDSHTLI